MTPPFVDTFKSSVTNNDLNVILGKCIRGELSNIKEIAELFARSGNPDLMTDFAELVDAADTKEIMRIIEDGIVAYARKTGDYNHLYEHMFVMADSGKENFNLERFEDKILESESPKLAYYAAGFVSGINQLKMLKGLKKFGDDKYIKKALQDDKIEKSQFMKDSLQKRLKKIEEEYLGVVVPKSINWCNFTVMTVAEDKIIATNNGWLINELAESAPRWCNTDRLFEAEMKTGDKLNIYEYAGSMEHSNYKPLTKSQKNEIKEYIFDKGHPRFVMYLIEYTGICNEDDILRGRDIIHARNWDKYNKKIDKFIDDRGIEGTPAGTTV